MPIATTKWGQRGEQMKATVQLTVTAALYAAGQNVGGLIEIPNFPQKAADEILLWAVELSDQDKQNAAYDLLLFDDNPAASVFTDHVAQDLNQADLLKHVDTVQFLAANYVAVTSSSVIAARNVEIPIITPNGTSFYAALVVRTGPTFVHPGALQLKFSALRSIAF